jgi:alkylation response protein AidB-like acyl-CoA dehydrogenase
MEQLPWERTADRHHGGGVSQSAIDWTLAYVKERKVFRPAGGQLPEHALQAGRTADRGAGGACVCRQMRGTRAQDKLDTATASMAKYWTSDLQCQVMDECVQLFGGYGYMWEYPITRAYADARVQRIYGGTNEIMKEVISRAMGLGVK